MKSLKILAGIIGLSFMVASCSKYEDGPAISLVSKLERVANDWEIEKAERNGDNVTEDYDQYELYLDDDYSARLVARYTSDNITFVYETDGSWEFNNDKEELALDFDNDDADSEYIILRLTSNEMWLQDKSDDTELHFETKQ